MSNLRRTPLYPLYEMYRARTIDYGQWELPVQFSGILKEHSAVRNQAGLFDISHLGEFRVTGRDAEAYLQYLLTNDVSQLAINQVQYTLMCYLDGGVVDNVLLYKLAEEHYMLVVNAANVAKNLEWLQKHIEGEIEVEDISQDTALLAVQGPKALEIVQRITETPLAQLNNFHFIPDVLLGDVIALVSRTGYTGLDGFELYVHPEQAIDLWERLLEVGSDEGLLPCGLGARNMLRIEAGLPLYGYELSPQITPFEAGLDRFVKLDKGPFVGRELLSEQHHEVNQKIVGIEMIDRGIPRSHCAIYVDGQRIGEITSGTQVQTSKLNVGLALIDAAYAQLGSEVLVEIRGKRLKAKVVNTPFHPRG